MRRADEGGVSAHHHVVHAPRVLAYHLRLSQSPMWQSMSGSRSAQLWNDTMVATTGGDGGPLGLGKERDGERRLINW
jgi:hypothetical protein